MRCVPMEDACKSRHLCFVHNIIQYYMIIIIVSSVCKDILFHGDQYSYTVHFIIQNTCWLYRLPHPVLCWYHWPNIWICIKNRVSSVSSNMFSNCAASIKFWCNPPCCLISKYPERSVLMYSIRRLWADRKERNITSRVRNIIATADCCD